jgi:hypothetical protein
MSMTMNEDTELIVERLQKDPRQQQEWLRENNLVYGGLIGAGGILVQPFLSSATLDAPGVVCVVAFAVAIPLLAALAMLNQQEVFRERATRTKVVDIAKAVGQLAAFIGVVAAFWHITWIAGVVLAASAGLAVHSAGWSRLELGGD